MEKETVLVDGEELTQSDIRKKLSYLFNEEQTGEFEYNLWEQDKKVIKECTVLWLSEEHFALYQKIFNQYLAYIPDLKVNCEVDNPGASSIVHVFLPADQLTAKNLKQRIPWLTDHFFDEDDLAKVEQHKFINTSGADKNGHTVIVVLIQSFGDENELDGIEYEFHRRIISMLFPSVILSRITFDNSKLSKFDLLVLKNYYDSSISAGISVSDGINQLAKIIFKELSSKRG